MKKFLTVLVLAIMCAVMSLAAFAATDTSFRVVSFNILNSDDKETRFDAIKTSISELSPDLLGFQECREGFNTLVADVKATGYASVVDKLVDDPDDNTIINCVPILYNTDRFSLVEGSAGARRFTEKYQESWTKSMCYCVLQDKVTSQKYIVTNVHFAVYSADYGYTHEEVRAQRVSNANELLAQIKTMKKTYGDLPVIAFGDYNTDEPETAYRILISEFTDAAYIAEDSAPYHTSSHTSLTAEQTGGYPVDHVFVTGNAFDVSVCKPYVTTTSFSASDHYPVYADLTYSVGSGETCKEAHTASTPLVILDAAKNSPFSDKVEGFTVMNVSTKAVDLSHFIVWYGRAKTQEELDALDATTVTNVMRLPIKRGEVMLQPGEKAYIWFVTESAYKETIELTEEKWLVSQDSDGNPVYNVDVFREAWEYLATQTTYKTKALDSNIKVIPLDVTTRDVFGASEDYRSLESAFNLQNSYYVRLYLSYDSALDASSAFCSVNLDGTDDGTYINDDGEVASNKGIYSFIPTGSAKFMKNTYIFGGFTVKDLLSSLKACINNNLKEVWDMNGDGKKNMIDVLRIARNIVS